MTSRARPVFGVFCMRITQRFVSQLCVLCVCSSCLNVVGDSPVAAQDKPQDHAYAYFHDEVPEIPWSIHIFKLQRRRTDFEFCTTLGSGNTLGMATVSDQVKSLPQGWGQPIAAINGDFYENTDNYPGDPRDLQIRNGEVVSAPAGHTCFWIDQNGCPHMTNVESQFRVMWPGGRSTMIGLNEKRPDNAAVLYTPTMGKSTHTSGGIELILENMPGESWHPLKVGEIRQAQIKEIRSTGDSPLTDGSIVVSIGPELVESLPKLHRGSTVKINTETNPDVSGAEVAVGGGPMLVRKGKPMTWPGFHIRHPRVALGWNKEYFYLVEVDGRQRGLSAGMTFEELAAYMVKIGCEDAMNMDGGGSATLWVRGSVMNSPSEGQERPGANALVIVHSKPKGNEAGAIGNNTP